MRVWGEDAECKLWILVEMAREIVSVWVEEAVISGNILGGDCPP